MSHEQDQTNAAAGGGDATFDDSSSPFDGAEEGDLNAPSSSINLEKADRSLSEFKRWYDEGDLVLDPEWQRNYVWNRSQKFGSLDRSHQRALRNSTLRSFELSSEIDPNMHFLVFERLNTGGTRLNEMEIRNCIFRGKTNTLIKNLSESKDFVGCLGESYERTHSRCQNGIKKFLNEFLDTYRNPTDDKIREYERRFEHCIRLSKTVFGDKAFRLMNKPVGGSRTGEWATRANASVFQCISTSFSDYDAGQVTRAADRIREGYLDLVTSDDQWIDCVQRATGERARLA